MSILIFDAKSGIPQQCYGTLEDGGLCGEMLADDVNECAVCGYAVAWKRSKTWTVQFGKWQVFVNRVLCVPTDDLGLELLGVVGNGRNGKPIKHFAVPHDLDRWKAIIKALPEQEIRETFRRCWRKGNRGHGLIKHVLNACDQRIEEMPPEPEPQVSAFEGLG